MEIKQKTIRARNFAFLIYPDSVPAEWFNFLNDTHIAGCVSPLHDKDVFILPSGDHKAGDLKKPHKHVLLSFNGNKTINQILELLKPLLTFSHSMNSLSKSTFSYNVDMKSNAKDLSKNIPIICFLYKTK